MTMHWTNLRERSINYTTCLDPCIVGNYSMILHLLHWDCFDLSHVTLCMDVVLYQHLIVNKDMMCALDQHSPIVMLTFRDSLVALS